MLLAAVRAQGQRLRSKENHGPPLQKVKIVHVGICRAKAVNAKGSSREEKVTVCSPEGEAQPGVGQPLSPALSPDGRDVSAPLSAFPPAAPYLAILMVTTTAHLYLKKAGG